MNARLEVCTITPRSLTFFTGYSVVLLVRKEATVSGERYKKMLVKKPKSIMVRLSATSAPRKLRQENCSEFEDSLGYMESSKPVWTTETMLQKIK